MNIAEVVFNLPLERSFHYLIPPKLQASLQSGMRVIAPFGPRERVGFVVARVARSPFPQLKPIRRIVDPVPLIGDEQWALASWLSRYYYCSLGEALASMVPSQLRVPVTLSQRADAPPGAASLPHPKGTAERIPTLTAHQRKALQTILSALDAASSECVLLHGVTASGKTELYLKAIEHVLQQGRSAICLIPEIALTPQTIDRFRERFGTQVAVWHSRLTAAQRAASWQAMQQGSCRIVVGARSAVFAPIQKIGLIILDEEHETTYKQADTPRYHARDVALARARLAHAAVVLGSATPSIESYYAAARGHGHLVTLPERITGQALPRVEIVDLREEIASRRRFGPLSRQLERALDQTVARGEQVMLLLNRRGFARAAQCKTCGTVVRCTRCSVPLIYHATQKALLCHYCNFQQPLEELCAACKKGYLHLRGSGTERIESELHRLFPMASIARMDRDTTKRRESHRELYEAVKTQHVGLLVGTQMIAKGLDFPQVTLVGIISADTSLNLPDFRSGERTFDLLTQMAGRAGRGDQPGRVIIQTYCPQHYAIQAASRHDYGTFYREEIQMRRRVQLPPFVHLIELIVIGGSRERVDEAAGQLAEALRREATRKRMSVLGPAPHRVPRVRRTYRACVLLKGRAVEPMVELLRTILQPGRKFRGLPIIVDVDPL